MVETPQDILDIKLNGRQLCMKLIDLDLKSAKIVLDDGNITLDDTYLGYESLWNHVNDAWIEKN